MNDYRNSLIIAASPAVVYAALTTPAGLRGWWSEDSDADTHVGGTLRFRFNRTRKAMTVERLEPEREVRWLCTEAHIAAASLTRDDEWVGTRMVFRLAPEGNGTRLDFEHIGLTPEMECHRLCSDGWNHYLQSLAQYAATGRGTPHQPQTAVS